MRGQSILAPEPVDDLLDRADHAADNAVVDEADTLSAAFASQDVIQLEQALYRVFRHVYLHGYADGRSE